MSRVHLDVGRVLGLERGWTGMRFGRRAVAAAALLGLAALLVGGCPAGPGQPGADGGAEEALAGQAAATGGEATEAATRSHELPEEVRLRNLRQLTAGGVNAEAYFSFDETRLVFQSTRPPFQCDHIFVMGVDGGEPELISTGTGRTTCGYFLPGDREVLFSSTHRGSEDCPERPDMSQGYVWPLYDTYDIFVRNLDTGELRQLTDSGAYDAEATVSPKGDRIVFTSTRDGDLNLYSMALDGSDVRQLTDELGYQGGAFYSLDGSQIVYRWMRPETEEEIADYKRLLKQGLVRPSALEIWVMDADGSNQRQVTDLGAASFAPFFHPDGERVIFSSNAHAPGGRDFDLYIIGVDGTGLTRVTHSPGFDGFPMFNADGTRLVFGSHRNAAAPREMNIFIADWVDDPAAE